MTKRGRCLKGVLILAATTGFSSSSRAILVDAAVRKEEVAPSSEDRGDVAELVHSRVQEGIIVQKGCAQAISGEEAQARMDDETLPGGTITLELESRNFGRTGNHFVVVSALFSMAFCCKSKMLLLPGQYNDYGGRQTESNATTAETGHCFEFSSNHTDSYGEPLPHFPEFEDLADRPDVCPPLRQFSGGSAYWLKGVHPDLARCMNRVFVPGCEANYLDSVVDGGAPTCPLLPEPPGRERTRRRLSSSKEADEAAPQLALESTNTIAAKQGLTPVRDDPDNEGHGVGAAPADDAGPLVIHVRSGDIFHRRRKAFPQYGQPPADFYLSVIASRNWSSVSIITGGSYPNPAFTMLKELASRGLLGPNVETLQGRSFRTDLQAMLCAENLVLARSTLAFMLLGHSRAKRFFLPTACGPGTYYREDHSFNQNFNVNPDNSTLLCLQRPDAEVYGIEWRTSAKEYSIYESWNVSEAQLLEMLLTDEVEGIQRCCT